MKTLGSALALLVLIATPLALAAPRDGVTITHSERLQRLTIRSLDDASRATAARGAVSMRFDAMGRSFELALEPNTALLSAAARRSVADNIAVLRGSIDGDARSWARIVLADGRPNGLLYDGRELYAIETGDEPQAEPTMFRLTDMIIEPGAMSCAAGNGDPLTGQQVVDDLVADVAPALGRAEGAVEEIEIGGVSDATFTAENADPAQAILTRLNNVDGIYSSELGIQIVVPIIDVFDEATDPLTDTGDPEVLIAELAEFRGGSSQQNELGLTHLFTSRSFEDDQGNPINTVGIAYINVLCSSRFGAGLTAANSGVTTDTLIAAHEIGHNFGAQHDGDAGGSCPDEPSDQYIMAARVNGNPEFSACSTSIILDNASRASCIVPLPTTDVTVSTVDQPGSVLLGNAINLNFAVDNRGSMPADNVTVEISLPTNVSLSGVSATQGNCASGAGSVSCDIGSIAGSSGVVVALATSTDAPGAADFTAVVSATVDENSANNEDTHTVTIQPAVDFAVAPPAPVNVALNGSGTAAIAVENTSILPATDVLAAIELDAGITANSAAWTAGSCEIVSDQRVDCRSSSFAALSSSILTLGVIGVSSGTRGYTVTLSANEADADDGNNVGAGSFNVVSDTSSSANSNTRSGSGSGGGSTGAVLLLLLAALGARRRRLYR